MTQRLSPEEVILQMSYDEICELLSDLSMDSTLYSAIRLKRLVRERGQFELAIENLCGPTSMQNPKTPSSTQVTAGLQNPSHKAA